jgi:DNA modification methylase
MTMPKGGKKTSVVSKEPYWQTKDGETCRLYLGHVIDRLKLLPPRSVQTIVTSPPYWGLRDYNTGTWEGGDPSCDHKRRGADGPKDATSTLESRATNQNHEREMWVRGICGRCGAIRVQDEQLGSEEVPDCARRRYVGDPCGKCYVCHMIQVFRELRRVLRLDGTVWLNIGDSYAGVHSSRWNTFGDYREDGGAGKRKIGGVGEGPSRTGQGHSRDWGLSGGNLVGVPWRLALALQADGWVLRQDIIWAKPSPMPESVRNRCTKAHEYIFLLTQSEDYFYDAEAIKEDSTPSSGGWQSRWKSGAPMRSDTSKSRGSTEHGQSLDDVVEYSGNRNKRSVWSVDDEVALFQWLSANDPDALASFLEESKSKSDVWNVPSYAYAGAHFATFPPRLIEPCILAGTSERGCCSECGKPYRRVVEETKLKRKRDTILSERQIESRTTNRANTTPNDVAGVETRTVGWQPGCGCDCDEPRPCIVLDPFMGSGTTAVVSIRHGRWCWGIDLSESYLRENAVPRIEGALFDLGLGGLVPRPKAKRSSLFDGGDDNA